MPAKRREKAALAHQLRDPAFRRFLLKRDMRVHACESLSGKTGEACIDQVHFIGVNVIYCEQGSFVLSFSDHDDMTLAAGEAIIVFPNRFVSFKATDGKRVSTLSYIIVCGDFAEEYVSSVGFYDFCKFPCAYPRGSMLAIQQILENRNYTPDGFRTEALGLFHNMLLSLIEQARMRGDAFFYDAVRIINRNLARGICRLQPLCAELGVSRTQLQRIFARNGFSGASAFIKRIQLNYAVKLLGLTRLSVSEISLRCGFASSTQFSAFVRQHTGKPPIRLRSNSAYAPLRRPDALKTSNGIRR